MPKGLKFSQPKSQLGDEHSFITDFSLIEQENNKVKIVTFKQDVLVIEFDKKDCPITVKKLLLRHLQQQSYSTLTI